MEILLRQTSKIFQPTFWAKNKIMDGVSEEHGACLVRGAKRVSMVVAKLLQNSKK